MDFTSARCTACDWNGALSSFELRHGTFLFCDLVGSTRLINALQPDEQLAVMQVMRSAVQEVVSQRGGRSERFDGDGYFVSFVDLESREDDAVVAILVGLDVASAVAEAGRRIGHDLKMRVGIASGAVVVGHREQSTVVPDEGYIGAAVNLAKRLVGAAAPGGVLVADATRRLAGQYFNFAAVSDFAVPGFDEPVRAWQALSASGQASRFLAHAAGDPQQGIVGRDSVLQRLDPLWRAAREGRGSALLLRGEPGIGKSCLAHWLRSRAQADGAAVVDLDCAPRAAHTPFYPVALWLRRLAGVPDFSAALAADALVTRGLAMHGASAQAQALAPYVPVLLSQAPQGSDGVDGGQNLAERSAVALAAWLRSWSDSGPMFLLAEDLHWADDMTLKTLSALCEQAAGAPLLLLATARPGTVLPAAVQAQVLDLAELDGQASAQLVRNVLGEPGSRPGLVEQVVRAAEGIPLYLEELALSAARAGSARAMDSAPGGLSAKLAMLTQARIDRMPALRAVAQAASVIGRDFPVALLDMLVPDPRLVPQASAEFIDQGLWERRHWGNGEVALGFKHALIHEAVYQSMLPSDRRVQHLRVASVLQARLAGDPQAAPDIVAHHLAAGGRPQEAAASYLEAATRAAARGAFKDSAAHCREGIAQAQPLAQSAAVRDLMRRLYTGLGMAVTATSGYAAPEVEAAYNMAGSFCTTGDDPTALFPIVRGLGTFNFVRARFAQAQAIADECLALAQGGARVEFQIEALSFLGYCELYSGQVAGARVAFDQCMTRYRDVQGRRFAYPSPQDAGTSALSLASTVAWLQGDCQAAERLAAEALAHASGLMRPIDEAYALVWLAMLRNLQRRFGQAQRLADQCIAISQAHGFDTWLAAATLQRCVALCGAGPAPQALATLGHVLAAFKMAGAEANATFFLWGQALGARHLGQDEQARGHIAQALAHAQTSGETFLLPEIHLLGAELDDARQAGSGQAARSQALELAQAQGSLLLALRAALALRDARGPGPAAAEQPVLQRARKLLAGENGEPPPPDGWMEEALARALD